jgi:hypothetical protein
MMVFGCGDFRFNPCFLGWTSLSPTWEKVGGAIHIKLESFFDWF